MTAIGIDLGTTNSVIARLIDGRPVAIPIHGDPIVPSTVLFGEPAAAAIVGRRAQNLALQHPERVVRSAKRKIGTDQRYAVDGRSITPQEVSAAVLRELKRGAEEALGEPVRDVVITVPAYFDDAQRRATLLAGELAGLHVLRLLNEPTAASLVYDQVRPAAPRDASPSPQAGPGESDVPELVLVYDLGGGTFDVSVLEVYQGVREVRATSGNTHLGGDDFDEKLVTLFLDHLRTTHGADPRGDLRAMARLSRLAEETKIRLSQEPLVAVREQFLMTDRGQPVHLELDVSRRTFEALIGPMIASTIELAEKVVREAGLAPGDLARVCLVGGSTRIPLVQRLLGERLQTPVEASVDVDLAVALGAAVQAGILLGEPLAKILVDVAAHTLGIQVHGDADDNDWDADTFAPMILRNTVLPARKTDEFYTMAHEQRELEVAVFQGERPRCSENTPVGSFRMKLAPRPAGSPVHVTFGYDLDGVVRVTVQQPGEAPADAVALSVADRTAPNAEAGAPRSAVERKASELLERVSGRERAKLERLIARYRIATGDERVEAEEALLDFFLDHEA